MVMQPSHTLREPVVVRMYDDAAATLLRGIDWGLLWIPALARQLHCILDSVRRSMCFGFRVATFPWHPDARELRLIQIGA
jgi:hypothetical protein